MIKQLKVSALLGALLVSTSAFAAHPGYLDDQATDKVVRNNYGECWRTASFDKAKDGLVECGDREAVKAVVAPVMVLVQEKISLSADVFFNFAKATLRPEAKEELGPLVEKLKANGDKLQSVELAGYTDFYGSDKYNQKLSQERADTVRTFLVENGVAAEKVTAVGKGKAADGLTQECKAKKLKTQAEMKACVAGDRRVDVTINAMKESMIEQK
ncbi:OmpA family protein [Craterilacuibacter sp. RT1T]|uniref:OmpA family protein n=1 Tax=Craterilacuibacter sp. RT1T TaxID=2942211 RepID=UPI0020BE2DF9|nr:OmpA family protein [Craterilacuibacter sp. RT1T]MCL6264581.1 OmpA family protein [Craterilacuibacter sp. RT1T]